MHTLAEVLKESGDRAAFEGLVNDIASEQMLAFVGAGCSRKVGYPEWPKLLDDLHTEAQGSVRDSAQGVRDELKTFPDMLWRAEEYRRFLGDRFQPLVAQQFKPNGTQSDVIDTLVGLPFRHFITTNYDASLEEAHARVFGTTPKTVVWSSVERRDDVLDFMYDVSNPKCARSYVHLHGHYDDPGSIVLTEGDYTRQYIQNDETTKRLFALFAMHRILFVGFSLNDLDVMSMFREVNAALGFKQARHYALVASDASDYRGFQHARLIRKFGINAVFFNTTGNDFSGFDVLIKALAQGVAEKRGTASAPAAKLTEHINVVDADDPHKGQFGGSASHDGWTLSATVTVDPTDDEWFDIELVARAGASAQPAKTVVFHLHPTFARDVVRQDVRNGVATLELSAWGAFTVGVECGSVRLELDLAEVADAPPLFKAR